MSARNSEQFAHPVIVAALFCLSQQFILLCGAENPSQRDHSRSTLRRSSVAWLIGIWVKKLFQCATTMLVLLPPSCMLSKKMTEHRIQCECRYVVNVIARVQMFHARADAFCIETSVDLVAKKNIDVCFGIVPG